MFLLTVKIASKSENNEEIGRGRIYNYLEIVSLFYLSIRGVDIDTQYFIVGSVLHHNSQITTLSDQHYRNKSVHKLDKEKKNSIKKIKNYRNNRLN